MSAANIKMRLGIILSKSEMERITIKGDIQNTKVQIDVHGLKCAAAKRLVKDIIALLKIDFILIVIHGYNHGTAIKDMLDGEVLSQRVISKEVLTYNQGVTKLYVAA